ncbi:hypothetical protein ACTFIV_002520 [Dictyostelium citrinum]
MKITIRSLLGHSFELEVDLLDTTEDIKRKIEKHTDTPFDQQRLLLSNKKRMEEGATIEDSGIIDGDHIVLFIRLPNRRSLTIDQRSDSYTEFITSIEKELINPTTINSNSNLENNTDTTIQTIDDETITSINNNNNNYNISSNNSHVHKDDMSKGELNNSGSNNHIYSQSLGDLKMIKKLELKETPHHFLPSSPIILPINLANTYIMLIL